MSRIAATFAANKRDGRKGFIPFVTAGYPDLETSLSIVQKLAELGADVIELGVPFSDPMADGPTIQRSSQRALDTGTTLRDVLKLASEFRKYRVVGLKESESNPNKDSGTFSERTTPSAKRGHPSLAKEGSHALSSPPGQEGWQPVSADGVVDLKESESNPNSDVSLVLFSYYNPILRFGLDEFQIAAAEAGIDGVLLTDVIEDEAAAISRRFASSGIDLISLIAPTTTDERLKTICQNARGFIYAVSRSGVTGARESTSAAAEILVQRARRFTDLPIAVGFGISTAEQIADVWRYADAAVVGSAIVEEIGKAETRENAVSGVARFVRQLLP